MSTKLQVPQWLVLALLMFTLTACKEALHSRLSEPEANEVLAVLSEAGIAASKQRIDDSNYQVDVDGADLQRALLILRSEGLPPVRHPTMGEVFKKEGLVSTANEERIRYLYALSEELAATLRKIDGVVDARVHVVIPFNDPLSTRTVPSSASVFIKHRPNVDLGTISASVKDLVIASVEGLKYENVALIVVPSNRSTAKETSSNLVVPGKRSSTSGSILSPTVPLVASGGVLIVLGLWFALRGTRSTKTPHQSTRNAPTVSWWSRLASAGRARLS